jgi:hypothetical protein
MIPKDCYLTDKQKLKVILKGECHLTSFQCEVCSYSKNWQLIVGNWATDLRMKKKKIIRIK